MPPYVPFAYRPRPLPDPEPPPPSEGLLDRVVGALLWVALAGMLVGMTSLVGLNYRFIVFSDGIEIARKPSWTFAGTFAWGGRRPGLATPTAVPAGDREGSARGSWAGAAAGGAGGASSIYVLPGSASGSVAPAGTSPSAAPSAPVGAMPALPAEPGGGAPGPVIAAASPAASGVVLAPAPHGAPAPGLAAGTRAAGPSPATSATSGRAAADPAAADADMQDPATFDRVTRLPRHPSAADGAVADDGSADTSADRASRTVPEAESEDLDEGGLRAVLASLPPIGGTDGHEAQGARDHGAGEGNSASSGRDTSGAPDDGDAATGADRSSSDTSESGCARIRRGLDAALARYDADHPDAPMRGVKAFVLIAGGYLAEIPTCPEGGHFKHPLGSAGVICTVHGR